VTLTAYEEYTEFHTLNTRKEGESTSLNKLAIHHQGTVKFVVLMLRKNTRLKLGHLINFFTKAAWTEWSNENDMLFLHLVAALHKDLFFFLTKETLKLKFQLQTFLSYFRRNTGRNHFTWK